jgi:nicotinamide riboside transporter PnuC
MTEKAKCYALFVLANVVTFTCIGVLQFVEGSRFFLFLAVMHLGIFTFIVSKRRFSAQDPSIKHFYGRVYRLLALYIPLLLYKLAGYFALVTYRDTLASGAVACVLVVSVVGSIMNARKLHVHLFKKAVA